MADDAPNPYIDLLQRQRADAAPPLPAPANSAPAAAPAPPANPYLGQLRERQGQELAVAQLEAEPYTPEQAAEARRLGEAMRVPPRVALQNLKQLRTEAERERTEQILRDAPALAGWAAQSENLNLDTARGELEGFAKLGESIVRRKLDVDRAAVAEIVRLGGTALAGAGRLYGGAARAMGAPEVSGLPWWMDPEQILKRPGEQIMKAADFIAPPADRRNFATDVSGAVGQLAGYIGVGALTGGVGVGAVGLAQGAEVAGARAEQAQATQPQIDAAASAGALVTGATERLGVGFIMRRLPEPVRQAFTKRVADVLLTAGGEAAQEYVENVGHNLVAWAVYDPDATNLLTPGGEEAAAGTAAGLVRSLLHVRSSADQQRRSTDGAEQLGRSLEAAAALKTTERSPAHVEDFVRHVRATGGPVPEHIYIDAADARVFFQEQGLDPDTEIAALVGDQQATTEGLIAGDLVIPYERFLARVAKSEHAEGLKNIARLAVDDLSPKELGSVDIAKQIDDLRTEFQEQAQTDSAAALEAQAKGPTPEQEVFDAVKQDLLAVGFDEAAATTNATLLRDSYARRAVDAGVSPLELYRSSVRAIVRETPASETVRSPVDTRLDPLIDAVLKGSKPAGDPGQSFTVALAQAGGLKPVGELRDMDAAKLRPGLISNNGMSLDQALVWAYENGFLASPPTQMLESYSDTAPDQATLFDMIDRDLRGDPVYRVDAGSTAAERFRQDVDDVGREIAQLEEETGRRAADMPRDELKRLLNERQARTFAQAALTKPLEALVRRVGRFIDEYVAGKVKPTDTMTLGPTPPALIAAGLPQRDLEIIGSVVQKITAGKHKDFEITPEVAKAAVGDLADPLAVFASAREDVPGGFVVVTRQVDRLGDPVVVVLHANKAQSRMVVNRITTIHSRENAEARLTGWAKDGLLRYFDDEAGKDEALASRTSVPLYLGKVVHAAQGPDASIPKRSDLVNAAGDSGRAFDQGALAPGTDSGQAAPNDQQARQQDLFAGYGTPQPEAARAADVQPLAPLPRYESEAELVKTGTRRLGASRIRSISDAANATAYLGVNGVERLDAVVTDAKGRPLAVIGGFKGTIDGAPVYARTLVGEAFGLEGAANLWLSHNHPSGNPNLSAADKTLTAKITQAFAGSRIKVRGTFAIAGSASGPRAYTFLDNESGSIVSGTALEEKPKTVAVVERIYKKSGVMGQVLNSPSRAGAEVMRIAGDTPGIVFLNTHYEPIAFVPWAPERASQLKDTGGVDDLFEAAARANAAAAMIAVPNDAFTRAQVNNLASALAVGMEIRVLDAFLYSTNEGTDRPVSMAERGHIHPQSVFMQDLAQADGTRRDSRARIEFLTDGGSRIVLTPNADFSSLLHEFGHLRLEELITDATREGARPQLAKDLDTLLAWMKLEVRTSAGAAALRAAIQRPQHEQFARGFEAYLREGKAPSLSLRRVFADFKQWLLAIYRQLRDLDVELSDEVRGVMDRLLATDEAIEEARREQGLEPVLPIAEMRRLGLSEAKVRAYADALERAKEKLGAKLLGDLWRKNRSAWRAEERAIAAAVDAETRQTPIYNAIEILTRGQRLDDAELAPGLEGLKLSGDDLKERYGSAFTKRLRGTYSAEGGQAADVVAAKLGFASGDELVQAIVNTPPRKVYIRAEARRRMEAAHPDSMVDGSLPERAQAALHNSKMGAVLQSELELLGQLANQPVPPPRVIRAAARQIVDDKAVRDVQPYRYLVAERKAARQAATAAAAGHYAEALVHKRRQAINAALYSEGQKAKDLIARTDRWMRRTNKGKARETLAAGGQDFLVHVEQLKHAYGYLKLTQGRIDSWQPLQAFLDALQDAGEVTAVTARVMAAARNGSAKDSRSVPVGELRELYEAVKNLAHLSSVANKVRLGAELVDRETAIAAMVARAEESGLKVKPLPQSVREYSATERIGRALSRKYHELLRPENIIEMLDGGQAGPWHDYWFAALDRAEVAKVALMRRLGARLKALRAAAGPDFQARLDQRVTVAGITRRRATVLAMVLNSGNAGNLQRLMNGGVEGKPVLTAEEVQQLRETLSDEELAYAQGLWDAVDSLWSDIVALQRRAAGVPVEKVQPQEFVVRGKKYRGGYWTLAYHSRLSAVGEQATDQDALRTLLGAGVSRAFTPKGYQKARVEELSAPLQLDYAAVLSRHLDQVMTDLAYREPVKHLTALLRSTRIKQALHERVGEAGYDSLRGQLAYTVSANSDVAGQVASGWHGLLDATLSNLSVAALGLSAPVALGNLPSSMIQGLDRAGVRGLLRGLWRSNRLGATAAIKAKSPFMLARLEDTDHWYQQELRWTAGERGFEAAFRRVLMTVHRWADFEVSRAVWMGTYLENLARGEAEAVRLADKAIRQTQTASARKDLSTFERDKGLKQTRQFMGPMFVIFARLNESLRGVGNRREVGARAAGILLQVFLAPAIFALAAGRWPRDEDDDEELSLGEWLPWLAANTLLFPIQTLPLLRDVGSVAEAYLTGEKVNPRAPPVAQAGADMARAGKGIVNQINAYQDGEDLDWWDMTRDLITLGGPLAGLPASQFRRTTRGLEVILDEESEDGKDPISMLGLLLYGPPKP